MTAHVDLAASLVRARARRDVTRVLAALSKADALAVLLDVYAELELDADALPQAAPPLEQSQAARLPAAERVPAGGTYSERLLRTLAANPRSPISDLTVAVYGVSDSNTRGKTRSLLSALRSRGEVENVGEGIWQVVGKEAMKQKS